MVIPMAVEAAVVEEGWWWSSGGAQGPEAPPNKIYLF